MTSGLPASLSSEPSLADSKGGVLPSACSPLQEWVYTLSPSTLGSGGQKVQHSSPGQGPEPWHWTCTSLLGANQLVTMPTSRLSSAWDHQPALAMEVLGSLPSVGRAQVVQEPLGFITTPGVQAPHPQDSSEGAVIRENEGQNRAVGGERGSAVPTDISHLHGSLSRFISAWHSLPSLSSKTHLSVPLSAELFPLPALAIGGAPPWGISSFPNTLNKPQDSSVYPLLHLTGHLTLSVLPAPSKDHLASSAFGFLGL